MINASNSQHRDSLLKRLARIEGQIRGLQTLIRNTEDCELIAQQFSAARKALDRAYQELLICLVEDTMLDTEKDGAEKLTDVRKIFTKYT